MSGRSGCHHAPMTRQTRPGAARRHRALVAVVLATTVISVLAAVFAWANALPPELIALVVGGMLVCTTVGALIEDRRPGQVVGRICLAIGITLMCVPILMFSAIALDTRPGRLPPLGAAMAMLASTIYSVVILLGGPLLVSRFPDGRDPGRAARLLDVLLVVSGATFLLGAFRPGPIEFGWIEPVDNPLGVSWLGFFAGNGSFDIFILAYATAVILALAGLVRRYRRGSAVVRAQIRWVAAAIATPLVLVVLLALSSGNEAINGVAWSAWIVSLVLPPIAIGVAILRYRLYDIDRIVSNTIAYGFVTAVLFGTFVIVNLALVSRVSPLVNNEGIAVAAATLLAAALFNPLRIRVQRIVDRRFHRATYDAERMVSEFAARLRDELDLPTLANDLESTTTRAVEPTSADLWLRGAER